MYDNLFEGRIFVPQKSKDLTTIITSLLNCGYQLKIEACEESICIEYGWANPEYCQLLYWVNCDEAVDLDDERARRYYNLTHQSTDSFNDEDDDYDA